MFLAWGQFSVSFVGLLAHNFTEFSLIHAVSLKQRLLCWNFWLYCAWSRPKRKKYINFECWTVEPVVSCCSCILLVCSFGFDCALYCKEIIIMVSYRFAIHYVLYYRYSATVHLHVQEQEKCLDSYSCLILLGYFFFQINILQKQLNGIRWDVQIFKSKTEYKEHGSLKKNYCDIWYY